MSENTSKENTPKRTQNKTICAACRDVYHQMMRTDKVRVNLTVSLKRIMEWGGLSQTQAALFAYFAIAGINGEEWFTMMDLQNGLDVEFADYAEFIPDMDYLLTKGFFALRYDVPYKEGLFSKDMQFYLPDQVENDVCYNRAFTPYIAKADDANNTLSYIFRANQEGFSKKSFYYFNLIRAFYKDDPFLKRFLQDGDFEDENFSKSDGLLFFTATATRLWGESSVPLKDALELIEENNPGRIIRVMKDFKDGKSFFLREKVFKIDKAAVADDIKISWGDFARESFFGNDADLFLKSLDIKELGKIDHKDIKEKTLFYNPSNEKDVERLEGLCDNEKYEEMRKRLEEKNMPKGLIILLYGAPGTGKTETAMQVARKTGRDLYHVNIQEVRSCWVGESEKNTKQIFEAYRNSRAEKKPILLFNEADAVVSKRTKIDGNNSSVTKMENSMQNIILEEMENFDGIMILTTNLEQQLDEAFDRRILFKLKFENPTVDVSMKIWKHKLEMLSDEEARKLAANYSFSGAQIENIRRKITLDEVLYGSTPNFNTIEEFCSKEKLFGNKSGTIGFRAEQ